MDYWFWVWLVAAVALSVAEIFTAGFFMLPFGIGAALAALLAYFGVALVWQWVVFVGLSSVLLFTLRGFSDRMTHEPPQKVAGDRLIGRPGVVIETIDHSTGTGRVRVDREEWRADALSDGAIEVGGPIVVLAVVGAHLVVEPAPHTQAG
jgi:membrane protein implicated in regulation of membrane protease activity